MNYSLKKELKSLFRDIRWFKKYGFTKEHELDGGKLIREKRERIKEIYSYKK